MFKVIASLAFSALLGSVAAAPTAPACSPLEVISARGTTEPQSGSRVMAPVINQVLRQVPGATLYNVVYPANTDFFNGPRIGARDMINRLTKQAAACPDKKFAIVGYSQGAMVTTTAMPNIGKDLFDRVVAVTMFGNPDWSSRESSADGSAKGIINSAGQGKIPANWEPKTKDFCNLGDPICNAGSNIGVHLSYGTSPQSRQAANFIVSKVK